MIGHTDSSLAADQRAMNSVVAGDTHDPHAVLGAHPSGGKTVIRTLRKGAKAVAVLQGKPAPTANDVRLVAPLVLQHRIIPNYAAVADDIGARRLVDDLLQNVREPAYR